MFCVQCGTKLPDGAKFCMKCGAKLMETQFESEEDLQVVADTNSDAEENINILEKKEKCVNETIKEDYIIIEDTASIKGLLNGDKLAYYSGKYLQNGVFEFKIKDHYVRYPEKITMYISVFSYYRILNRNVQDEFKRKYQGFVSDMDSFINKGLKLYADEITKISESVVQLLVSSGIMTVNQDTVRKIINAPQDRLAKRLVELFEIASDISAEAQSNIDMREMKNALSSENTYIAGGVGFSGVMSGMAAATLMNFGSNMLKSLNTSIANSRDRRLLKDKLDKIFVNEAFLNEFLMDLDETVQKALDIYIYYLGEVRNIDFEIRYNEDLHVIAENSMKYKIDNEEHLLESLCNLLSDCPEDQESLEFLTKYYFKDDEILNQISELSGFLLFESEFQEWKLEADRLKAQWWKDEQERKRKQLSEILSLPETTVSEISKKINILSDEAEKIGYDSTKEIKQLNSTLLITEKREKEAELNKAKELPERTIPEIEVKITSVIEEANKIGYDVNGEVQRLHQKKENLNKENLEKDYRNALHLTENTIEEIDVKIQKVSDEAAKIGYSAKDSINRLQKKKSELKKKEEIRKKEDIWSSIAGTFMFRIYKLIDNNDLMNDIHVIMLAAFDQDLFDEEDIDWVQDSLDYYCNVIRLDEDEFPIAFYYDNMSKNPKDSFAITTKRVMLSNLGVIESVTLDKIKNLVPVEKVLTSAILINDEYKLSLARIGRKKVENMLESLSMIIEVAKLMNKITVQLPIEDLEKYRDKYVTKEILKEMEEMENKNIRRADCINMEDFKNECEGKFFNKLLSKEIYHEYLHPAYDLRKEEKKQYNLIYSLYETINDEEEILLFYDNTMFRNMKESFVLTDQALHFRSERFITGCIELEDIESINVKNISLFPNFIINHDITIPVRFLSDGAQEFVNLIRSMR